jgi:hypothetical protein
LAFLEEAVEGLEIFGVEGIVDIFFEVEAEVVFGEMHLGGGFGGDLGDLGQAEVAGGLEVGDYFCQGEVVSREAMGGDGVIGEGIVAGGPDG